MLSKETLMASSQALETMARKIANGDNKPKILIRGGSPLSELVGEFDVKPRVASMESLVEEISVVTTNPMISETHSEMVDGTVEPVVQQMTNMIQRAMVEVLPMIRELNNELDTTIAKNSGWTTVDCYIHLQHARRERSLDIPHVTDELSKIRPSAKPPRKIFCPLMEEALSKITDNRFPFLDFGVTWINKVVNSELNRDHINIKEILLQGNSNDFEPLMGTYLGDKDCILPHAFELINFFYWYHLRNTSQESKVVETATVNTEYWIHLIASKVSLYDHLVTEGNLFYTPLLKNNMGDAITKATDSGELLLIPVMTEPLLKLENTIEAVGIFTTITGFLISGGNPHECKLTDLITNAVRYATKAKALYEYKNRVIRNNEEFKIKQCVLITFRAFIENNASKFVKYGINTTDPVYLTSVCDKVMEYLRTFKGRDNEYLLNISNVMVSIILLNDEPVFEFISKLCDHGKIKSSQGNIHGAVLTTMVEHYMLQTCTA